MATGGRISETGHTARKTILIAAFPLGHPFSPAARSCIHKKQWVATTAIA